MSAKAIKKTVWITGASSGIGAALARTLARRGAKVFASGRNREKLEELCGFGDVRPVPFDTGDREAALAAAEEIRRQADALDWAVLNAGICEYLDVRRWDAALVRRVMEANFFGFANCAEAALPLLRESARRAPETPPVLAAMCSAAVYCGLPRAQAYVASKSAVRAFVQCMEGDLAAENIRASAICPGFVKTPLTDRNDFPMPFLLSPEKAAENISRGLCAGRAEIAFPARLVWALKILSALPAPLRRRILAGMARK